MSWFISSMLLQKQHFAPRLFSNPEERSRLELSTQVLQEFYVAVTRKLVSPLDSDAPFEAVRNLSALLVVQIDPSLILLAIRRSQVARLSFWDSLIVEAALATQATLVYSEDLQDGRVIEGLRIVNPFAVS
jgi:predicted nucleic acid-binding protein